jgi:DnaK suppressor protein
MTAEERAEIQRQIAQDIENLRRDVESLTEATQPIAPDVALGRLTRMDAIQSKSVNEANLRDARERLQNLEAALARVDREDFGTCMSCGQPIAAARLAYMPETTACVECAGKV